jgi:membrane protease subunit HflK
MTDEHRHEDEHGHRHGQVDHPPQPEPPREELDAAGKSLADALRISFAILKVIMIVLVIAFLASGFKTVGSDEKALVLRFGKIKGGDKPVLDPGLHWVLPYPIDDLVRIPAQKSVLLAINTFWYKEDRQDILGAGPKPRNYVPEKLDPLQEGYCLTGSQRVVPRAGLARIVPIATIADLEQRARAGYEGSDYGIVHTRWQINYQIAEVEQFFRSMYVQDPNPGEVYFDVMMRWITPLLASVVEDAVVNTLVRCSIDEVLQSTDTIRRQVHRLAQKKLDDIESGIRITQVQLVDVTWPKQVDESFRAFIEASQKSGQAVSEARTDADNTLTKTAGRVGEPLYRALQDKDPNEQLLESLWAQAAGDVQDRVAQAEAYRTRVVEGAKANANYLMSILPEYRARPQLVLQGIYLDAIQKILQDVDEKFVVDKSDPAGEREFRILLNRDTTLKPKQNTQRPAATP